MFLTRSRERLPPPVAFLFPVLLLLASCGGGYGSGNSSMAPTPTVMISVQPTTITAGQAATVTWSAQNASTCTASGAWSGNQPASGTQTVTPTTTGSNSFTLTCTAPMGGGYMGGGGGSVMMTATLTVNPASAFSFTSLVTDTSGQGAATTDAKLLNPWGIVFGPGTPVWVANNHSETSTLYDGNGKAQPPSGPLVVSLPNASDGTTTFDPTGIVFNSTSDFVVRTTSASGVARFIFTGEGGMISGWSPTVDLHNAIIMYTDTGGAVYKGLALASNGTANFLYAADFHNNKVDVFDATYTKQPPPAGSNRFVDPNLPSGYAPFGIQAIKNGAGGAWQLYVAYAKPQPPDNHDNMNGAGLGLIDIYDAGGAFVKRLVSPGGALNAPWGLALAPADFGTLSNVLLVGNFGDGKINGFDPSSGTFMGAVSDSHGAPFASPGLWGIAFGNDTVNQPHNTLFYAAGPNDEANGVYGRIDLGGPPALNTPPSVLLTVPSGTLAGTVTLTAGATDSIPIANIKFYVNGSTLIGTATTSPYTVQWNTTTVANGQVSLTAVAIDTSGNVGSTTVMATVGN
jgi:uncharacterized protein (TIGR03118 family)